MKPKIPKKYQPRGYEILYEDRDLLVGNKAAGVVTVKAKWSRDDSVHDVLNNYLRKGNPHSRNCAFVVHRLDQATTGVLMFAKCERAQFYLKENWSTTVKTYFAVVLGRFSEKSGRLSSFLVEDEDYVVHSNAQRKGKLAHTEYQVVNESENFSLVKINLLTGRKNQIRVHMADAGHSVVGDNKYGDKKSKHQNMALHSSSIEFTHPHSRKRITVEAPLPRFFAQLVP